MSKFEELPNEINGFKIIKDLGYNIVKKVRRGIVECKVCKREYEVAVRQLRYRKHCGCIKRGSIVSKYSKSHPRLSNIYKHMIARCYNSNNQDFYNYGAREISVCDEWKKDRNTFCQWALANGYQNNLTLDRIDFNGNYEPSNCRWVNSSTQARNSRRNVLTMEKAELIRKEKDHMTFKDLAKKYGCSPSTVSLVVHNKIWRV